MGQDSQNPLNEYYQLGPFTDYVTGELRALTMKTYHDPLTVSFKVLMNYDKTYGLLADESYTDSALAYLNRIGETARYNMLKQWISIWKNFWSDYDFLIQQVDGLAIVENWAPQDNFNESEKIVFQIRETADMLFTGLMATYRQIWHDDIRVVEVLPANLRRFDMSVLVFNANYFNMDLYDIPVGSTIDTEKIPVSQIEQVVFPTLRKLSDQQFSQDGTMKQFNHVIYKFLDVNINTLETGSQFAGTVTNDMSGSPLMQNLSLNFRFATYSGRFNNIMGNFDFAGMLAVLSAQNRIASLGTQTQDSNNSLISQLTSSLVKMTKDAAVQLPGLVKNKAAALTSSNQFLGQLVSGFTAANAASLVSSAFAFGINYVDSVVLNAEDQLASLIVNNFNSLINLGNQTVGATLLPPQQISDLPVGQPYVPIVNAPPQKNPQLGEYTIYKRRTF
jgi:hypothetical protein